MSDSLPKLPSSSPIKRKQMALALFVIAGLVGTVVFGLWLTDPKRKVTAAQRIDPRQDITRSYRTPGENLDPNEVWIERSDQRLRQLDDRNKELERQLKQMQDDLAQGGRPLPALPGGDRPRLGLARNRGEESKPDDATARDETGAMESEPRRRPPLPPPPGSTSTSGFPRQELPPPPPAGAVRSRPNGATVVAPPLGILSVRIGPSVDAAKLRAPTAMTVHNTLPTGSFSKAVLLSGVDAPTGGLARTNPHPVLLRVQDNAQLPNRFRSRIKECFATAAAYGDLSSERAYMRLEKLSCVLHTGEVLDLGTKGYVVGEDGKNGFRGTVVSKQGQLIARALFAGIASGLVSSIAQSYSQLSTSALGSVQTVDPSDVARVGLATGVSNALEKIADFYIERANELYPFVEVDSGRIGELVLTDTVNLGEAFEKVDLAASGDFR